MFGFPVKESVDALVSKEIKKFQSVHIFFFCRECSDLGVGGSAQIRMNYCTLPNSIVLDLKPESVTLWSPCK